MWKQVTMPVLAAVLTLGGTAAADAAGQKSTILKQRAMYEVTTAAGSGDFSEKDGPAMEAAFRMPSGVELASDGTLLIADTKNQQIRRIQGGKVLTLAGNYINKDAENLPVGGLWDGPANEAFFNGPLGISADGLGNYYVADNDNHSIRKIDRNGNVSTIAGSGVFGSQDGAGKEAGFHHPSDVAAAPDGILYVADTLNHLIRKIDRNGKVTTLNAASDRLVEVFPGEAAPAGDFKDGPLQHAKFNEPTSVALDGKGNLYVSDSGNQRIRYIDLKAGTVSTVAGGGAGLQGTAYNPNELYAAGDYINGKAPQAKFDRPAGIALTSEGGLLIADMLNHAVRYLFNGQVYTLAGSMDAERGEADGVAAYALLDRPADVAAGPNGVIYIADSSNHKIRKLAPYQFPEGTAKGGPLKVLYGQKAIGKNANPISVRSRVMIPLRAVTEALGYKVSYGKIGEVLLSKGTSSIELKLGSTQVSVTENGKAKTVTTDAAPFAKNGTTFVPVRFFAEAVHMDVQWNAAYQAVILRDRIVLK
ncbi:stalk domain-containing protein [Paenibacillus gansuensis]|uniref:Stalk domain-containing protein n=1 Tax=Paenibacillus gansuensis TaxID=306542 RepID=A0ABW5PD80_9BACL